MAKYDLETFCSEIKAQLVANLNTKIAEITAEKNDTIVLRTVDAEAYFFQSMNNKQANFNPFILYAVEDIANKTVYGGAVKSVTVQIALVLVDSGEDSDPVLQNRMFRYLRALEEVFQDSFQFATNAVKVEVQSLRPDTFPLANSIEMARVVGINLIASFA